MLNEQDIEKLIEPIVERQQSINLYILEKIAKRIKEIGTMTPSDVNALTLMVKRGADVRDINNQLARLSTLQVKDIKAMIKYIAEDSYKDAKRFYDYNEIPYIPFEKNTYLQMVITSVAKQTADTYINLAKAQAFMLRDPLNPSILTPTPVAQAYQKVLDEAIQASQSGISTYNVQMQSAMKQLVESGIRNVTYNTKSGKLYTQRLDTAVRRNLLDGVRAINQGVQDEVGKQFGADGKEITVHENPAPDHAPVQGHQFTNEEFDKLQSAQPFKDVNGNTFSSFKRAIGTLNCRHFTFSIVVGVINPTYSESALKAILERNNKGYTFPNGKHLTMYECTQYQRKLELELRKAHDGQSMAEVAGNDKLKDFYTNKVKKLNAQYKKFSNDCGLKPKWNKTYTKDYSKL